MKPIFLKYNVSEAVLSICYGSSNGIFITIVWDVWFYLYFIDRKMNCRGDKLFLKITWFKSAKSVIWTTCVLDKKFGSIFIIY